MSIALELCGVTKRFVAGTPGCWASANALCGLDLAVFQGEAVALVGGSASGKSTALFCAAGLLKPDAGSVRWFGDDSLASGVMRSTYHCADERGEMGRRVVPIAPHVHLIDGAESLRPESLDRVTRWIARHRARGDAVLISTRNQALAYRLADRTIVLSAGRAYPGAPRAARVAEGMNRLVSGPGIM